MSGYNNEYSDLKEIKKRIYEDDKVVELLESLDCEYIYPMSNRIECQLPYKFGSNNKRSVQVYLTETLPCKVRSRGVSGDIFSLVSYLLFEADNDVAQDYLYQSKSYICNLFDWTDFLEREPDYFELPRKDYLSFLRPLQKQRKQRQRTTRLNHKENPVLKKDKVVLWYENNPHKSFLDDGISIRTQREFEVMFDRDSERVVFPIYNKDGELISMKWRYVGKDSYIQDNYKYLYMYNFDKMIELYNFHRALPYIKKFGEVIVFESEKSCMKAWQYNCRHTLAIMGSELSPYQAFLLRKLEVNIIFAFDNDMSVEHIRKQASQIKTRKCFYVGDDFGLLDEKQSPVDVDKKTWENLYNKCLKVI